MTIRLRPRRLLPLTVWFMLWGAPSVVGAAPTPEDPYLAGYAGAVLEREFKVTRRAVTVDKGVLTLDAAELGGADRDAVVKTLSNLPGVVRVVVREPAVRPPAVVPDVAPAAVSALPTGFLPTGHLFQPLLADPRWPHFSAAYRYYLNNRDLGNVGAVNFGETIPLFRGNAFADSQWEVGIQAGVFALFDMDAPSKDLLNADYFGALFGTWRRGAFSALGRLFHQSSHLGDELLLRTTPRAHQSHLRGVDLKLSYDLPLGFRVYGGGGFLFDQEPENLKPWSVQGGVEFRSPRTFAAGYIRPVVAVDLQSREENNWNARRVGARGSPVRERARARAKPAGAPRVLQRQLAGWAVLQAARRVPRHWRPLPFLTVRVGDAGRAGPAGGGGGSLPTTGCFVFLLEEFPIREGLGFGLSLGGERGTRPTPAPRGPRPPGGIARRLAWFTAQAKSPSSFLYVRRSPCRVWFVTG